MTIQNYDFPTATYGNTFQGVKFNLPEEANYSLGDDLGEVGIPVTFPLDPPLIYYLHIAYADKLGANFSMSDPTNRLHVGYYIDDVEGDSESYADYEWVLMTESKNDISIAGLQDIPSIFELPSIPQDQPLDPEADPIPDIVPYLHIKHSEDYETFATDPSEYIGVLVDELPDASEVFEAYTWLHVKDWIVAKVVMQLRMTPESNAVATFPLPHIDQYSFEMKPFVVKAKPNAYKYDILISFVDGREKTYIGGNWTINPVITKK